MKRSLVSAALAVLSLILAGPSPVRSDGTIYAYERPRDAPAVADLGLQLGWMAGHWRGTKGDGVIEEIWSALEGDSMMGMFRLVSGGELRFYEFISVEMLSESDVETAEFEAVRRELGL